MTTYWSGLNHTKTYTTSSFDDFKQPQIISVRTAKYRKAVNTI